MKRPYVSRSPVVSVIIPAYNKPQYLTECLRSIQAQRYTDWECIVVSDGSPRVEEVRAAVEGMNDERFRLIELPENRGPAAARNAGVRAATAENYVWVDEDDLLGRECLERLVAIGRERGASIVRPQIGLLGKQASLPRICVPSREEVLVRPGLHSVGFLVSKAVLDQVGLLDENPVLFWGLEDVEWWIRVVWASTSIEVIDDVLYWYRPAETAGEKAISQHFRGMRHAVEIGEYIVKKHDEKYRAWPEQRREFLARCYGMQVAAEVEREEFMAAFWHATLRLRYQFNWRNAKTAVGLSRMALAGKVRSSQPGSGRVTV